MSIEQTRYISCADTAKLVRTALKAAFPGVKFSVKSKTYSGGASITIRWMDGPTSKEVEAITNQFEGASFDGMQDLKSYHDSMLNGERVHYCANYIFTSREYSVAFLRRCAQRVHEKYGGALVEIREQPWGGELIDGYDYWSRSTLQYRDLVLREAQKTSQKGGR